MKDDLQPCPYCGEMCDAHFESAEYGQMIQVGPYHCTNCGASEISPHHDLSKITDEERRTFWYKGRG